MDEMEDRNKMQPYSTLFIFSSIVFVLYLAIILTEKKKSNYILSILFSLIICVTLIFIGRIRYIGFFVYILYFIIIWFQFQLMTKRLLNKEK